MHFIAQTVLLGLAAVAGATLVSLTVYGLLCLSDAIQRRLER